MSKTSAKVSIARLVKICELKGLKKVVISPGSRNAPLTLSFAENNSFECLNIPDERVAAFFALGMAQSIKEPVILCCTSGTALLNYAPAIAEAYHQKIPLLILSADRPLEWIDQRAGQTMKQRNVFQNYIKKSFELIEEADQAEHLWYNDRMVNEAVNACTEESFGPVHLNVPMRQPLYELTEVNAVGIPKKISYTPVVKYLPEDQIKQIKQEWSLYSKVLVIVGQHQPSERFNNAIRKLAERTDIVVMTETTSNVVARGVLPSIDRLIDSIGEEEYSSFTPELIISCGAAIVSKKIRFMLRQMKVRSHWHVDTSDGYIDTYQSLTRLIPVNPSYLFSVIAEFPNQDNQGSFKEIWSKREWITREAHNRFIQIAAWSDLTIMDRLLQKIPPGVLHLASSTPIRYSQLFEPRTDLSYWCNRGVSGIDGCTSTAAGYAHETGEIVTLITGDIAFFYDSNAFWHHHVPGNLRVILINNSGGNIFRYVKGPDTTAHLEKHFEATHETNARGIASSFGIDYFEAEDFKSLEQQLGLFFGDTQDKAAILEVRTPREINIPLLKKYFDFLRAATREN